MTNKLTFRELRTNLKGILDRMEQGEVFEVRDRVLCLIEKSEEEVTAVIKGRSTMIYDPRPDYKNMKRPFKDLCEGDPLPGQVELQEMIDGIQAGRGTVAIDAGGKDVTSYIGPPCEHSPCGMCGKSKQLYKFYENGEDYEFCEDCLKAKLGKHAKKYICEMNKVEPKLVSAAPTAVVLRKPAQMNKDRAVNYCIKCKCAAASRNSKLCVKCGSKKKKK